MSFLVIAALVLYAVVVGVAWRATRGNVVAVVLSAYLIAPAAADNVLPQVTIYPASDSAVRTQDFFLLADLVLLAALLLTRPRFPRDRLMAGWMVALLVLAVYPLMIGLWWGVGQSVAAVVNGALLPLRGIGILWLVAGWAHRHGWEATIRVIARVVVLAGVILAVAVVGVAIVAGGAADYTVGNYAVMTDGRPSVPGWGNNILANYLCVAVAVAVLCRRYLALRSRWTNMAIICLLVGIAMTGTRTAMLVALVVAEVPLVLLLLRRWWPRRGAVVALLAGVCATMILAASSIVALSILNPRFKSLAPRDTVVQELPSLWEGGMREEPIEDSRRTRMVLLEASVEIWRENPLLGVGWNGWGWEKSEVDPRLTVAIDPHNGFLWLAAEAGALGLVLLYAFPLARVYRRLDVWGLCASWGVACLLEAVNANLRNAHFAVVVWALAAAIVCQVQQQPRRGNGNTGELGERYTFRRAIADSAAWIRGVEREKNA